MAIRVRRKTGIMGGLSKLTLLVNDEVVKISNNEEYSIDAKQAPAKIKAKQWNLGSEELLA